VVDLASVTKAAEKMHISPGAIKRWPPKD